MRTVFWENNELKMIDQRILPGRFEVLAYRGHKEVAVAITDMVIIGILLIFWYWSDWYCVWVPAHW